MRLVLDASAAVNAVIPSELRDSTREKFEGADLCAPTLIDTEVLSAIARLERGRALSSAEADQAVRAFERLPLTRFPIDPLLDDIWTLRGSLRISDAHYVALARAIKAPVLTADGRLARSAVAGVSVLVIN